MLRLTSIPGTDLSNVSSSEHKFVCMRLSRNVWEDGAALGSVFSVKKWRLWRWKVEVEEEELLVKAALSHRT